MGSVIEGEQRLFFVQRDGRTLFAHWAQLTIGERQRTKIAVYRSERLLLPRSSVGLGLVEEEYDLGRDDAERWLTSRGYRVVSSLASE